MPSTLLEPGPLERAIEVQRQRLQIQPQESTMEGLVRIQRERIAQLTQSEETLNTKPLPPREGLPPETIAFLNDLPVWPREGKTLPGGFRLEPVDKFQEVPEPDRQLPARSKPKPQIRPEFEPKQFEQDSDVQAAVQKGALPSRLDVMMQDSPTARVMAETANALFDVTGRPYVQILNWLANQAGFESRGLEDLANGLIQDVPEAESTGEVFARAGGRFAGTAAGFLTPGGAGGVGFKAGAKLAGKAVRAKAAPLARKAAEVGAGIAGAATAIEAPAALEAGESPGEVAKQAVKGIVESPARFTAAILKDTPEAVRQFTQASVDDPETFKQALELLEPVALLAIFGALGRVRGRKGPGVRQPRVGREPPDLAKMSDGQVVREMRTAGEFQEPAIREFRARLGRYRKEGDPARAQAMLDDVLRGVRGETEGRVTPEKPVGRAPTEGRMLPLEVKTPVTEAKPPLTAVKPRAAEKPPALPPKEPAKLPEKAAVKDVAAATAPKEYERKHQVMKSTGYEPDRSPESLGISAAGLGKLIDPKGKVTTFATEETAGLDIDKRRRKMMRAELNRRLKARRRGGINLAGADVAQMQKLFKQLDVADADALVNMHRAMTGNLPIEQLPKDAQAWVRHARVLHDDASEQLLGELLKAHGETALTESVRHNLGRYLHETLIPKSPTVESLRKVKALWGRKTLGFKSEQFKFKRDRWTVAVGRSHFKFDSEQDARDAHAALLNQQLTAVIKKKALERGVSASDLKKAAAAKKVKLVSPIPESERTKMFIRNPMVAWSISHMKTVHNAETLRYFRLIDKRFGETPPNDVRAGGEEAIAEWAKEKDLQLVIGNKNKIGVLEGRFLPKPIARDVNEMVRIPALWQRIYLAYLNTWKASKTVFNPPTHFRNIFGNFIFADLAGNAPWNPANYGYYIEAARDMVQKGKDWRILVKEGVVGSEYWGNEIKPVLNRMVEGSPPDVAIIETGKRAASAVGRLYNAEDVLYKVATYKKYVAEGMAPRVAAREVNLAFPNYAETWRATRFFSRMPLGGPFLSFNEQAIRIAARQVRKHPLKIAYWASFPGALTAFSVYWLRMDDDEKELVDASRSYFEPILPFRDEDGAALTLDLRYMIPLGNELQKGHDFTSGRSDRLEVPFILQQPPVSGFIDLTYNRDLFTGRDISKRGEPFSDRAGAMARHFLRENLPIPTIAIWGRERLQRAFGKDSTEPVHRAIAGALFGINVRKAYVNRKEAYSRLRALAMENPIVDGVVSRLLSRSITKMSYKALTSRLSDDERFQQLLDLYNTSYRYVGGPERGQDKEVKVKGVLQSIRSRVSIELKKQEATAKEPAPLPPKEKPKPEPLPPRRAPQGLRSRPRRKF